MAERGKRPIPKTQRKISEELQTPYVNPETGETRGNPNDAFVNLKNRENQISFKGDTVKPFNVGLQDIDGAVFYYFQEVIKPTVLQNGVRQNVPVIYGNPERWKQMQKDGYYRDKKGKIMMPLITFRRTNIEKVRNITKKLDANYPNNYNVFKKLYSQKNAYDKFNILNNRKPTEDYYAVVVPDYVTMNYECIVSTYYVEQMNGIIESINYASDSYWGDPEKFKFRARIDSYATNVELPKGAERVAKSTFSIKLYGYIVPNILQKDLASLKKYQGKVKLVFNPEVVDSLFNDDSTRNPFAIPHGPFTEFTDPPAGDNPSGEMNQ